MKAKSTDTQFLQSDKESLQQKLSQIIEKVNSINQ